jgi:hypothetical protein
MATPTIATAMKRPERRLGERGRKPISVAVALNVVVAARRDGWPDRTTAGSSAETGDSDADPDADANANANASDRADTSKDAAGTGPEPFMTVSITETT